MIKIELTKGQFQEIYDAVRDLPDEIREDLKIDGEEPDIAHLDLFSAVEELARIDKRLNKPFKQVKLNSPDWEWQLIMCHTLPRIGYKMPYNKDIKVNAKHSQVLRDTFNLDINSTKKQWFQKLCQFTWVEINSTIW